MKVPKVSIGLPVYNGENFIAEAIDSLLNQSFTDLELIVCDNASSDRTEEICRAYADQDKRVQYFRNETNIGAAPNYVRTFNLAKGEYFKWAAHDDVCCPDFLRTCVQALDDDQDVVLSYPGMSTIDDTGQRIKEWPPRPGLDAAEPQLRFREALVLIEAQPIWGLIRSDILRKTPLLGSYTGHDMPLIAELALHGHFHEVPEVLFLMREHQDRSVRAYDFRDPHTAIAWYDPKQAGKLIFPQWRLLSEYFAAISRVQLSYGEKIRCYSEMLPWLKQSTGALIDDLLVGAGRIPVAGELAYKMRKQLSVRKERWQLNAAKEIKTIAASDDLVILVGEPWSGYPLVSHQTLPFLEMDGEFYGSPANDDQAIQELKRMRENGATLLVFGWPEFWWLEYYDKFHHYLNTEFTQVLDTKHLVAFNLKSHGSDLTGRPNTNKPQSLS